MTSAGATDVFVAKFDPTGAFLWAKGFGNNVAQNGFDIAFAPNGDVVFTGSFAGTINLGGGALTSAGATDLFVARLDSAGTYVWGQRFGDAVAQAGKGITVDGQGNVIVTGDIAGKVDFGGGELTSAGATDVLLLKLDPTGAHVYSKLFGNASAQTAGRVAVDAVGNIVLTGSAAGKVDFGGGMLTAAAGTDIFVAKLTSGGVHLWSKLYGAAGNQDGRDIAVDPNGAVLVAGTSRPAPISAAACSPAPERRTASSSSSIRSEPTCGARSKATPPRRASPASPWMELGSSRRAPSPEPSASAGRPSRAPEQRT